MDQIFNTVAANTSSELTVLSALITMGMALLFGLVISFTYMKTKEDGYQQSFVITLTMLPVILSVIILFVGSNVARAFSLAGTLSIIRFRSAPGDPKDIGYIFFTIAAGLACGVGLYAYGAMFTVLLCVFMAVLAKVHFGKSASSQKLLKIVIPEDLNYEGVFDEILDRYTRGFKLNKVRTTDLGSLYELIYNINMDEKQNQKEFMDELRCRNGNLSITLALAENNVY